MEKWLLINKKHNINSMSSQYNISRFISKLLVNRDIINDHSIKSYLDPSYKNLLNPKTMKDLEKAVNIIAVKINNKSKIRIIGDYDVDGVISTYILFEALKKCSANVDYMIPHRINDGYGINKQIVEKCYEDKIDTIITCDNGISAIEPINYAKQMGMTVIITDHHDIPFMEDQNNIRTYISSEADAIVNPKQLDCPYEFKKLCGAGVAFKFIQVLYEVMGINANEAYQLIEYVAIATVCDVVDLLDENRIIVYNGLKMLNNTGNAGLKSLIRVTGLEENLLSVYHLGFIIGPCINASGRLDSAMKGVELLSSSSEEEGEELAKELFSLNQERKEMTMDGLEAAIKIIEATNEKDKILVVFLPDVHESLAGIIAGRVRERYYLPVIVLTKTEDGVKGSGRSIEEYNMFEGLLKCKDVLLKFGGHPMAAGLSLEEDLVDELRERLNSYTSLTDDDITQKIRLDMQLPLEAISYELINEIELMQPFGKGNPRPLFGEKDINIVNATIVGKNKNVLKLKLSKNNSSFEGIYFGDIGDFEEKVRIKYGNEAVELLYNGLIGCIYLDIAFTLSVNEYMDKRTIQLVIEKFR